MNIEVVLKLLHNTFRGHWNRKILNDSDVTGWSKKFFFAFDFETIE
jgi:hypothetical protein